MIDKDGYYIGPIDMSTSVGFIYKSKPYICTINMVNSLFRMVVRSDMAEYSTINKDEYAKLKSYNIWTYTMAGMVQRICVSRSKR